MSQPHIQIIVGSVRDQRMSGPVARWVAARFEAEFGYPAEIVDLRDWNLPSFNLAEPPAMGHYPSRLQRAWATTIARADGFVFVGPEYNHGYSGALKNALDWIYAEWIGKPAAFVSFGNANGSRATAQLKQVMGELRMVPIEPALGVKPHGHVEDRQFMASPDDERRLSRTFAELLRWQKSLESLRKPAAQTTWTGKRVLAVGLGPATNRSVVAPLRAAGIDAEGIVFGEHDPLPNGDGFDLVAIGRGAAGRVAEAVRTNVHAANPQTPIIDAIAAVAVRQIIAALDPATPALDVRSFALADGRLSLRAAGDNGRIGVTLYERGPAGLVPHRIAEADLNEEIGLDIGTVIDPYSVVVDLDGAAFWHRALP